MNKKLFVISSIIILILVASLSVGATLKWYDIKEPSAKLTPQENLTLITNEQYVWKTDKYWKEGNCYYYNLNIGNTTNVTWSDHRREITCTSKNLSASEIEDLQLSNVEWTLKQLSVVAVPSQTITYVDSKKGEDLKSGDIYDAGIKVKK